MTRHYDMYRKEFEENRRASSCIRSLRSEVKQLQTELDEAKAANKRMRDALEKLRDAKIANIRPASVALYLLFVKETAGQALEEVKL